MAGTTQMIPGRRGPPLRMIGWSIPVILLLIPLIVGAPWTPSDYVVMGVLLGIVGVMIEIAVRASGDVFYRLGAVAGIGAAFLLVWVNAAVGFLGDEDNPANLIFAGVLGVAILGTLFARANGAGMARAMSAAAAAQVAAGIVALAFGLGSATMADRLYEVAMGTTLFTSLWLASAALFRKAARAGQFRASV